MRFCNTHCSGFECTEITVLISAHPSPSTLAGVLPAPTLHHFPLDVTRYGRHSASSSSAVAQPPVRVHGARREHTRSERTPSAESYRPRVSRRVRRTGTAPALPRSIRVRVSFDMPDSTTRGVKPTLSGGRQEIRRRILVVLTAFNAVGEPVWRSTAHRVQVG